MATILVWDFAWWPPGRCLTVTFLDIGQGNAAVVQFPDRKTPRVGGGLRSLTHDNGQRVIALFTVSTDSPYQSGRFEPSR